MAKVLVADDDQSVRDLVGTLLHTKGHDPLLAGDGKTALEVIRSEHVDLAILDIGMPHLDGLTLTQTLRAEDSVVPAVLLLTSRHEPVTRYEGFLKGADDYVSKPFDPVELLLRVEALLKRIVPKDGGSKPLAVGPYSLDPDRFQFVGPDSEALLTRSEFAIMTCLFERAGKVVSVEEILREALDYPRGVGSPDTVHTHVRNIRHKIEADPAHPDIIRTVARLGYRIEADPGAP